MYWPYLLINGSLIISFKSEKQRKEKRKGTTWTQKNQQEKRQEKRQEKVMTEAEKIKQRNSDFQFAFGGLRGERVYACLSAFCLKKGSTFIEGSPDKSAFNEGARAVILEIDHWIEYDLSTLDEIGETDNTEPERKQDE